MSPPRQPLKPPAEHNDGLCMYQHAFVPLTATLSEEKRGGPGDTEQRHSAPACRCSSEGTGLRLTAPRGRLHFSVEGTRWRAGRGTWTLRLRPVHKVLAADAVRPGSGTQWPCWHRAGSRTLPSSRAHGSACTLRLGRPPGPGPREALTLPQTQCCQASCAKNLHLHDELRSLSSLFYG